MTIKVTGKGRDAFTELFDDAGHCVGAKAGKYSLAHMIKWWSRRK